MKGSEVFIPPRLAARPRDKRGLPIPASVLIYSDGTPDFRVIDQDKWIPLARNKCCGLCGEPLGKLFAFIGGPLSQRSRFFTDLPMHRGCAEYAMQVCPYLAMKNFQSTADMDTVKPIEGRDFIVDKAVATTKPEKSFIGLTTGYDIYRHGESLLLRAYDWTAVEWWKDGEKIK